jgi:hypothetical protein
MSGRQTWPSGLPTPGTTHRGDDLAAAAPRPAADMIPSATKTTAASEPSLTSFAPEFAGWCGTRTVWRARSRRNSSTRTQLQRCSVQGTAELAVQVDGPQWGYGA